MFWTGAVTACLALAGHASAGVAGVSRRVIARTETTESHLRRTADEVLGDLVERATTSINIEDWNTQTQSACTTALAAQHSTTNPSGMAVCYNIPTLDNSTGVFKADLRLYKMADATGDFEGIPDQDVQVSVSYVGASVSPIKESSLKARTVRTSLISFDTIAPRDTTNNSMQPFQTFAFVGQINQDMLKTATTNTSLQALLIPSVTLHAKSTSGSALNTSLVQDSANFVTGVFAVDQTAKAVTSTTEADVAIPTDDVFVVPGVKILIFPIGGVITGVWAGLLGITVGYGTIGRINFRDQFRRRTAMAMKGAAPRI